jgi:type IV pilus assembly protein PilV
MRGFGLIEVMLALIVISISLLGFATLQQKSLASLNKNNNHTTAIILANEIANRMHNNFNETIKGINTQTGIKSVYLSSFASSSDDNTSFINSSIFDKNNDITTLNTKLSSSSACFGTSGCSSDVHAAIDLLEWKALMKKQLPEGYGVVCFDNDPSNTTITCNDQFSIQDNTLPYTIKIQWLDADNTTKTYRLDVPIYTIKRYVPPAVATPPFVFGTPQEIHFSTQTNSIELDENNNIKTIAGYALGGNKLVLGAPYNRVYTGTNTRIMRLDQGIDNMPSKIPFYNYQYYLKWGASGQLLLVNNAIYGNQAIQRQVHSTVSNGIGEPVAFLWQPTFLAYIVASVPTWPSNTAPIVAFGEGTGFVASNHSVCLKNGGNQTCIDTSDIFSQNNPDTNPFIFLVHCKNNQQCSISTADTQTNIKHFGNYNFVFNLGNNNITPLSIGPFTDKYAYSTFWNDLSTGGTLNVGEFHYIDKTFTDNEINVLMQGLLMQWNFPRQVP